MKKVVWFLCMNAMQSFPRRQLWVVLLMCCSKTAVTPSTSVTNELIQSNLATYVLGNRKPYCTLDWITHNDSDTTLKLFSGMQYFREVPVRTGIDAIAEYARRMLQKSSGVRTGNAALYTAVRDYVDSMTVDGKRFETLPSTTFATSLMPVLLYLHLLSCLRGLSISRLSPTFGTFPRNILGNILNNPKSLALRVQDAYCNSTNHHGCSSADAWGHAIAEPIKHYLLNTPAAGVSKQIGASALHLHDVATSFLTPSLVNILEQQTRVSGLEDSIARIATYLGVDGKRRPTIVSFASQIPTNLVYNRLAPPSAAASSSNPKSTLQYLCNRLMSRLPACHGIITTKLPEAVLLGDFPASVVVSGFAEDCTRLHNGCIRSPSGMSVGSLFDGVYVWRDQNPESKSPVYVKTLLPNDVLPFRDIFPNDITSLVLWETPPLKGPTALLVSQDGISAAITPNLPVFDFAFFGPRSPFAVRKGLKMPSTCDNASQHNPLLSQPILDAVNATFPLCLRTDSQWTLAHFSAFPCKTGNKTQDDLCHWELATVGFAEDHNQLPPAELQDLKMHPL